MDQQKKAIVAAILAVTNMGQPMPEKHEIAHLKHGKHRTDLRAEENVLHLAGKYMESEEHEEIFTEEALMWAKEVDAMTNDRFASLFPDVHAAYEAA